MRNLNADAISITPHIKLYHALLPNDILPIYSPSPTPPAIPLTDTNPTLAKGREIKWQSSRKYKQKVTEEIGALLLQGAAEHRHITVPSPPCVMVGVEGSALYIYILVHTYIKDDFSSVRIFCQAPPQNFFTRVAEGTAPRGEQGA